MLVTLQGYRVEKQQDDGKKDKRAVMRGMIEQRKKGKEETRNRTISEQKLKKRDRAKEGWEQPIENNTCKFSTIVVEKDEYKDGHHEPDQKPPLFSFLPACWNKNKYAVSKRKRYHTLQHYTAQHNFRVPIVDGPKQNRMNFQSNSNEHNLIDQGMCSVEFCNQKMIQFFTKISKMNLSIYNNWKQSNDLNFHDISQKLSNQKLSSRPRKRLS